MITNNKYSIIDPSIQRPMFMSVPAVSLGFLIYWVSINFNWQSILTLYIVSMIISWHISVFAHRAWAHKAWKPNKFVEIWGLLVFTLLMTGTSVGYVGTHRQHHRHTDTEQDPHSPFFISRFRIQFLLWNVDLQLGYLVDMLRQPIHVWFMKYYWFINFAWFGILYTIDPSWLLFWLASVGITHMRQQIINSLAHNTPWWCFPIGPKDISNSLLLGLITPGESWHRNHHDDPANYNFSRKWYELDPPAMIINILVKFRLGEINQLTKAKDA